MPCIRITNWEDLRQASRFNGNFQQKKMALLKWTHANPAPNPFEALAGDSTEYEVHLCEASASNDEDQTILSEFLRPALLAALSVTREDAKSILFIFDPVYSLLTVVATDTDRRQDERIVYKLSLSDWDEQTKREVIGEKDSDMDEYFLRTTNRMHALLETVLVSDAFVDLVGQLRSRSFEFWFTDTEEETPWENIDV
jgi:hypothetical protein